MGLHAILHWMPRRPGKPTIDVEDAQPFWTAIQMLYSRVAKDGGYAELQRMAAARHYSFSATALRAQVKEESRPSQEMQRCIASMLGVSVAEVIATYGPNTSQTIVSPTAVNPWRAAVEMAAGADGFSRAEIERFFASHPERGDLNVAAALAIMGAMRRTG